MEGSPHYLPIMRIVQIVGLVAHFELVMGSKGLLESCDPQIVPATVDRATRCRLCYLVYFNVTPVVLC